MRWIVVGNSKFFAVFFDVEHSEMNVIPYRIHFRCFACTPSKTPKNHPFAKEHHFNQTSILHDVGFPAIRMIGSVFVQPGFVRAFKRARNPTEASIYGSNTPILKSWGSRPGSGARSYAGPYIHCLTGCIMNIKPFRPPKN